MRDNTRNPIKRFFILQNALVIFCLLSLINPANAAIRIGGVNFGTLLKYHMVFTQANEDANLQGSTRGFLGDIAINGAISAERTAGSVPYAGTIYTNDVTCGAWQNIINSNAGQAFGSRNNTSMINQLTVDLENVFTQINAMTVTPRFNGVSAASLNNLNTKNDTEEVFVVNITSGFEIASLIKITGDADDIFFFRWDTDVNFSNGYQGQVRFRNGGAFVPLGGLIASNFIHVAGDIKCSGGGYNPPRPYPQGPRKNNGTGALINGGLDFTGGGFFTGFWFTTGVPTVFQAGSQPYGKTGSLTNGIFVGGWYSKTNNFSLTSGSSGVYVAPNSKIGNRVWNDANGNGEQDVDESGAANVMVKLFTCSGSLVSTTTSDSNGKYLFAQLPPGNYYLQFIAPAGNEFTIPYQGDDTTLDNNVDPETGLTSCIALEAGAKDTTIDAGVNQNASIGNRVWNDVNSNGIQDAGEAGIVNVIVELRSCTGSYVNSTITDYNGIFLFSNIAPGKYYLAFILPAGYSFTSARQGINTLKDSDPSPVNGNTGIVTLRPGDYNASIDAGMRLTGLRMTPDLTADENTINNLNNYNIEVRSYPNPFTTSATIEFSSQREAQPGIVEIYSLDGRKIADLFHETLEAGRVYQVNWEPANVPNGTYLYKVVCGEKIISGRMILLK